VGLGNPGEKYVETRHNLGFRVLDRMANQWQCSFTSGKAPYETARCQIKQNRVLFVKPMTYMNRSGDAVSHVLTRHFIELDHLLVVCDDFTLPLGKLRFRREGSDGGHNGLASIIEKLDIKEFSRLRMGIDKDPRMDPADFVLARFKKSERAAVNEMVDRAGEAIADFIQNGIHLVMNRWNH
jgi:PTH1 family peptidyl-tRNA hydrolase